MILDSSFLIDLMNSDEAAIAHAKSLESQQHTQRIPVQVVYELYVGVGYTETTATERSKIQSVIETRPLVETTAQIAKIAGQMDGKLRAEGERVSQGDIIIGATARQFEEPVVTNNATDFDRLPGVDVYTYK